MKLVEKVEARYLVVKILAGDRHCRGCKYNRIGCILYDYRLDFDDEVGKDKRCRKCLLAEKKKKD